jgi:hypothetical protein
VVWPQNHSDSFRRFGLKSGGDDFSSVWVSKPIATVCELFGLKTTWTVFAGLASKPVVTVCWFGLKICCYGFLWFGLKISGDDFLQFGLKTGGDGLSRFGLKTGGRFLG